MAGVEQQIDEITDRQLRGDAVLAEKIRAEFAHGRATRKACDVDNVWAICRGCGCYRGDHCTELNLTDGLQVSGEDDATAPGYVELLTRQEFFCRRWSVAIEKPRRLPATSTTEEMVDRLHREGTTRSQAERKDARNAYHRGRRGTRRK